MTDPDAIAAVLRVISERLHLAVQRPDVASGDPPGFAVPSIDPVSWIRERLGLTATEEHVLWVLIAHELCPKARRWIRELATEDLADPTLDAIRRAVYGAAASASAWRELGETGRLQALRIVEPVERFRGNAGSDGAHVPRHRHLLRIADRVLALVHGEEGLDAEVARSAAIDPGDVSLDELEVATGVLEQARSALVRGGLVLVRGGAGTGRRTVLAGLVRERGQRTLVIDGAALARDREVALRQIRAVARECALLGLVPLIRSLDALVGGPDTPDRLDVVEHLGEMLGELTGSGLVLATTTRPIARRWKNPPATIELPALTGAQRARLWARALPPTAPGDADRLATLYPLAPALIDAAGKAAVRTAGAEPLRAHHVQAGIRSVLDDRLAGLATRVTVTQTWDDLILPEEQELAVSELLARVRERRRVLEDWGFAQKIGRGLGTSALFSGPPGTGKTMCAGLVAKELGAELYQVDVSKLVSKWIGETEKNLAALFDAAEAGHAILLFDEADSLFGKRTEVKSSNDRHANQETNYLLQRLESFGGICILTTNHEAALDEAFRRRLSVHVRFPMPEADERARLWQVMLPKDAPVAPEVPFERLGELFAMSGGYIKNAVLRAAFLAADMEREIDGGLLARAAQLEYEAMGKVVARR